MNERLKILHVLHFGSKNKRNGVIEAVLSLAQAQREAGAEVLVASASRNSSVPDSEYVAFDSRKSFLEILDTFQPDITHVHDMYWLEMPMVAKSLKNRQIPYILTFHGGASKTTNKRHWLKKKAARILMFNYVIRNAQRVVYLTEGEMRNSIAKRTNPRYLIIPNGISLPTQVTERQHATPYTIVFLSRMDFHGKGLDLLEQAIAQLKDKLSGKVQFRFYGYTYDDTYRVFEQYGDFAKYCGYVSGNDKDKILTDSDMMILPSRSEGMPVSILEGLAYGLPCIVTPQTNMADLVTDKHCGWVCQLSAQSIADTVRKAVADYVTNGKQLRLNAMAAAEEFSWQNVSKLSLEKYRNLLKERTLKL